MNCSQKCRYFTACMKNARDGGVLGSTMVWLSIFNEGTEMSKRYAEIPHVIYFLVMNMKQSVIKVLIMEMQKTLQTSWSRIRRKRRTKKRRELRNLVSSVLTYMRGKSCVVPLLTGLSKLASEPRSAIWKSALEVRLNILKCHEYLFSHTFWIGAFTSVIPPIFVPEDEKEDDTTLQAAAYVISRMNGLAAAYYTGVVMKNGRKVVCGTQNGVLMLCSWGHFMDCSDRFTGFQSNSIDVSLKLDEDRVITGSENGLTSLVGILPNRTIQLIAEHSEYSVERLAFSHDKKISGSISHDQMLKLKWLRM